VSTYVWFASCEWCIAEVAAFSKAQEAAQVKHGGAIVRTTEKLGVPTERAAPHGQGNGHRPAQPAQQPRIVFVAMYKIMMPNLCVDKLGKGDAEKLRQRAMCSIERYCPLVVRYTHVRALARFG
jgi:hypothetical protein